LGLQDVILDKVGGTLIRPLLCVRFTSCLSFLRALLFSAKNQLLAPLLLTGLGSTPTEKDGNTAADLQGLRDLHTQWSLRNKAWVLRTDTQGQICVRCSTMYTHVYSNQHARERHRSRTNGLGPILDVLETVTKLSPTKSLMTASRVQCLCI